jgi:2-keto-4-pentenoate hydratase/2-oxohepta-3-ene-1,7-dioic acid hydratase in catechol pathway
MKLIVLYNNYPATALNKEPLDVYTLPDTALLKDGKPLFIPDFADLCTVQTHLVVRICRLGRSISERFAHRYYDAITVGATFTAENLRQELAAAHRPWDLAVGFDGAAPVGKFMPLYEEITHNNDSTDDLGVNTHFKPLSQNISFTIKKNNETIFESRAKNQINHIDKIIAHISKHYTLRQGDIIFTGCPAKGVSVNVNDHIEGFINQQKLLRFNIK